jgi:GNAT superfamily N-acetyltransferase
VELETPNLVPLAHRHIPEVVRMHLSAFPGFFLTFLGPRFLAEFYRAFLSEPTAIAMVAESDAGCVCGVVVGTLAPAGFFKRLLLRRWWTFARASAGALLRRPAIAPRLIRALGYRGEAPTNARRALLSSIAVDPSSQGAGTGRRLVECWLTEAKRRGAIGCYLTTDAQANDAVNSFYCRLGWKLESTYATPQGRIMNCYNYDFAPCEEINQ